MSLFKNFQYCQNEIMIWVGFYMHSIILKEIQLLIRIMYSVCDYLQILFLICLKLYHLFRFILINCRILLWIIINFKLSIVLFLEFLFATHCFQKSINYCLRFHSYKFRINFLKCLMFKLIRQLKNDTGELKLQLQSFQIKDLVIVLHIFTESKQKL